MNAANDVAAGSSGPSTPDHDLDEMERAGIAAVLTPGATAEEIVAETRRVLDAHLATDA